MSVTELNQSRTYDIDRLKHSQGTTAHIVTLTVPATSPATGPLNDPGLPTRFSPTPHPMDDPTATLPCICIGYSIPEQMDAAGLVWKVVANWSNGSTFNLQPGLYSRESTFTIGTVDIPYASLYPIVWPTANVIPILAYRYKIEKQRRERKTFVKTIKTWAPNYSGTDEATIAGQVGKYHYFGGTNYPAYPLSIPFKFHGAQVSHLSGTIYQFVYTWSTEEAVSYITPAFPSTGDTFGTVKNLVGGPVACPSSSPLVVFPAKQTVQANSNIILYPYQRFIVVPSGPLTVDSATPSIVYFQSQPQFVPQTMFDPTNDIKILGSQVSLPGNPQDVV